MDFAFEKTSIRVSIKKKVTFPMKDDVVRRH